jgi:hypothetical protein
MKELWCLIFGHEYKLAQELQPWSRRVGCTRCHRSFAMNDDAQSLVPWDADFHYMYEKHGVAIEYQPWEIKARTALAEDKP